jgi:hypothetical protein
VQRAKVKVQKSKVKVKSLVRRVQSVYKKLKGVVTPLFFQGEDGGEVFEKVKDQSALKPMIL